MSDTDGLIYACLLDGKGGGREVGWEEIGKWEPEDGFLWIHIDCTAAEARRWLDEESGLDEVVHEALIAEETRPRSVATRDGLMLILRGVNLNPGADPEDMVSIRMWIDRSRAITLRRRRLMAVDAIKAGIKAVEGPTNAGSFLVELTEQLGERMGAVLDDLDDQVDSMEDEVVTAESFELRTKIGGLRRMTIGLRRYLAPQRDAMARLQGERVEWLSELDRSRLREVADRTTRYVEDLDSARDRAAVTQEELNNKLSEQMNRTMYALSIVAGIFLPLGLLTGLLGINVGGMPGTDSAWAFAIVCILLVVVAFFQVWIFRRSKWM